MEVTGRRLDRCDMCGRKTHRYDLVMQAQDELLSIASNNFLYSSYNSTFWTCSSTDAGVISWGPRETHRYAITEGATPSTAVSGGIQTWTGSGTFRSSTAVDASSWTNLVFSCHVGAHQTNTTPTFTVVMGFCDSGGTSKTTERTWTVNGSKRIWFTKAISGISGPSTLYCYLTVTNVGSWWVDKLQLEKNATVPGTFATTIGTAINRTTEQRVTRVHKVCPECRWTAWDTDKGITPKSNIDQIGLIEV